MNTCRRLQGLLAVAALFLCSAACKSVRREVVVDFTFAGQDCATAGVATIQIDRGDLTPLHLDCQDAAGRPVTSLNIGSFVIGMEIITVRAFNAAGAIVYYSARNVDIVADGSNRFAIDLTAVPVSTGSLTVQWNFDGQGCAAAGISSVQVALDGVAITGANASPDLPCSADSLEGTVLSAIEGGRHTLDVEAFRDGQVVSSLLNVPTAVQAGVNTAQAVTLQPSNPASASAYLLWTFGGMSCAEAKVDSLRALVDGQQSGSDVACVSGNPGAVLLTGLGAGDHSIIVEGRRGTRLLYQTRSPVSVTLPLGLTTLAAADAPATVPGYGSARLLWAGGVCASASTEAVVSYTIRSPYGQNTSGTSTCGGSSGNAGIEFCTPTSCRVGEAGLVAGQWTIDATATAGGVTSSVLGAHFTVPNADENTSNVVLQ